MPLLTSSYLVDWFINSDYVANRVKSGLDELYDQVKSEKEEITKALTNDFKNNEQININRIEELDKKDEDQLTSIIIQRDDKFIYISEGLKEVVDRSVDFNLTGQLDNTSDTYYDVYERLYFKDESGMIHVSLVINYNRFDIMLI